MASFTFAVLPDRTGGTRDGVFESAIDALNLLRPDFVIQIGDLIEGYAGLRDGTVADEWDRAERMLARLVPRLHLVVGNHDVNSDETRSEWLRRHGALHRSFRHEDVLFVLLDTQDPPIDLERELGMPLAEFVEARTRGLDEDGRRAFLCDLGDWNGTMRANVGEEQLEEVVAAIRSHRDVRWTFLLMHHPIWQGEGHPALDRIRAELGERPYTVFGGHAHSYRHEVVAGRDHIRVGAAGGGWVLDGPGAFDHVTLVRMTADGPVIANVLLDGIVDVAGRSVRSGALA